MTTIKILKFKRIFCLFASAIVLLSCPLSYAQEKEDLFVGQDLHLSGVNMLVCSDNGFGEGKSVLVFDSGFSLEIGANKLASQDAVVIIESIRTEYLGQIETDFNCRVYLQKAVSIEQGALARTVDMKQSVLDQGEALVAGFFVSGQVFATAENRLSDSSSNIRQLPLYIAAMQSASPVRSGPVIGEEAVAPTYAEYARPAVEKESVKVTDIFKMKLPQLPKPIPEPEDDSDEEPLFEYPVNLSGVWGVKPEVTRTTSQDGKNIATVIGRFYLWQKKDEKGNLLEFQADNAVIFYSSQDSFNVEESDPSQESFASGSIEAIYLSGNITMTEGIRTIRASEAYYNFREKQALAVKVEMRSFDAARGLPVYLRAEQLKQVSETVFRADDIVLTSSEFYLPQVSATASSIVLTDTTAIDARTGKPTAKSSYDGILTDMTLKFGEIPIFAWPKMRSNFERPDIPLKSADIGKDSEFGMSVETRWHLARLLGRKEDQDVDSTLAVDYFGDRGVGAGVDVEYQKPDHYGQMMGYIMNDRSGEDDLGRNRKDVQASEDVRGRFRFQHRHYLPYDWQATVEVNYESDENFMEWFYRSEFNTGKDRESIFHLKRIKDNWGFSILNKVRITDHLQLTEELPTVEFHLKGTSFWDDTLTFYSDSRVSRLRDRLAPDTVSTGDAERFYTFASTRNEVDLPLMWDRIKVVPYVAATFGYEDKTGYTLDIDNVTQSADETVWLGEAGLRVSTMFYNQDEFIKSRLWDINGIRHIVKPHLEAVFYDDHDITATARDMVNVGLSQRWQTRRGKKEALRSLDWMRLDVDATWVSDSEDSSIGAQGTYGPSSFIWNDPVVPIFDRRNTTFVGMVRDTITADYEWRLSDTATVLADANYDIESGVVQQMDVGFSRYVYPNLTFYAGNRYLRPLVVANGSAFEEGTNSLVTAISYALNPRYTINYSQEYNFDFGKNVQTRITVLRKYHRMFYAVTFLDDESRDEQALMFSVWPEGVRELGFGDRKYAGATRISGGEY